MPFVDHGGDPLTPLEPSAKTRKPRTRLTKWLAKIAGKYDGELEPKTEAEYYLNEIAENGGGGGTVTAEDAAKLSDAIEKGGIGYTEPGTELWSGVLTDEAPTVVDPAFIEMTDGQSVTLVFSFGGETYTETAVAAERVWPGGDHDIGAEFTETGIGLTFDNGKNIVYALSMLPDNMPITISTPDTVHQIDSKFLAGGSSGGGIGFAKKTFTFGAAQTIEAGQAATIVAYDGYTATPMVGYDTKLANWFSCDEKPGLIIISTSYILHSPRGGDMEGYDTTVFNASAQSISVKANTHIDYNLLYQKQ